MLDSVIKAKEMVRDYLTAKFGGEALPEEASRRLEICMDCEWRVVHNDTYYYCRECGCPKLRIWPDSELKKKTTFQMAKCPKNKW